MTTRAERLYRLATRAYPQAYRAEHGDELYATACELTNGRVRAREVRDLLIGGMRTRARTATTGPGAGVWVSGFRLALLFAATSQFIWLVSPPSDVFFVGVPWWAYAYSAVMVAALALGTGRAYATFSTVAMVGVALWSFATQTSTPPLWAMLPTAVLLGLVWWSALRTDGRRVASPLVIVLFVAGWWAVSIVSPGYLMGEVIQSSSDMWSLLVLGALGLAVLAVDPRLAAGVVIFLVIEVVRTATFSIAANYDRSYFSVGEALTPIAIGGLIVVPLAFAVRKGNSRLRRI